VRSPGDRSRPLDGAAGGTTPVARRAAVQAVLDDGAFMRWRKGTVPARVIEDAAIETMLRLSRGDSALAEQIAIVDKTLTVKKEDERG
jgi:hypothetical protein